MRPECKTLEQRIHSFELIKLAFGKRNDSQTEHAIRASFARVEAAVERGRACRAIVGTLETKGNSHEPVQQEGNR